MRKAQHPMGCRPYRVPKLQLTFYLKIQHISLVFERKKGNLWPSLQHRSSAHSQHPIAGDHQGIWEKRGTVKEGIITQKW